MYNREERPVLPHELVQRFRMDLLAYLPARLVPAAVGLASVMALTRLFPPEEFGRYALALAAGGIAQVVLGGWLRECTIRFWPGERAEGREDALLGTTVLMALVTAALPLVVGEAARGAPRISSASRCQRNCSGALAGSVHRRGAPESTPRPRTLLVLQPVATEQV